MNDIWSWALTSVGALAVLLIRMGKPAGWYVGLLGQPLWGVYAFITCQGGFYLWALLFGGIYGSGCIGHLRKLQKLRQDASHLQCSAVD